MADSLSVNCMDVKTQGTQEINPKALDDISYWPYLNIDGKQFYSIGSISVDRYLRIDEGNLESIMEAIKLMDGTQSIASIEDILLKQRKIQIDVLELYEKLKKVGLIQGIDSKSISSEISMLGLNLINYEFKEFSSPKRKIISFLWNAVFYFSFFIFAVALAGIILHYDRVKVLVSSGFTYNNSYILGGVIAALLSIFVITIHEISHAFTAVKFGLQPSRFNMILYGGYTPLWLVKIRGIYTVERKYRIAIMIAGMYSNILMAAAVTGFAVWFNIPSTYMQILSKILIINYYMVISCISPFILSDGYFIVTQLLKISNLRLKIFRSIKAFFNKEKANLDTLALCYFVITIFFMGSGIYYSLIWSYNMAVEVSQWINILALKYVIMAIPFAFTIFTMYFVLRRFYKYIKSV